MKQANNVATISHWMARLSALFIVALPIAFGYAWYRVIAGFSNNLVELPVRLMRDHIEWWQWSLAVAFTFIPLLALLVALMHLRALMTGFVQGQYFSDQSARQLYKFCACLLTSTLLKAVTIPLVSVALTLGNPPGMRQLVVTFDSQMIGMVFIASIFFVISLILKEAQTIARENAEFV